MITSPHNDKLKEVRRLARSRRAREDAGRFVAEGEDLLAAADDAGWAPLERYAAAGTGLPGMGVEPELLERVSALGSGTRTLAVYAEQWSERPTGPVCVHLHEIRDPGNVGAILRSAAAFGAASVSLSPGTADPYSVKAVRASMGAIFIVPVTRASYDALPGITVALHNDPDAPALGEIAARIQSDVGSEGSAGISLIVGAERAGLPSALLARAEHTARIPIAGDSLNAAMAATIALYELAPRMPGR